MDQENKEEMAAQDLIERANSLGELIEAIRRIGFIESLTPEVGARNAQHWIDAVKKVVWRHAKGENCLILNSVTRRFRLRFRLMELLGIECTSEDGKSEAETGMNVL